MVEVVTVMIVAVAVVVVLDVVVVVVLDVVVVVCLFLHTSYRSLRDGRSNFPQIQHEVQDVLANSYLLHHSHFPHHTATTVEYNVR